MNKFSYLLQHNIDSRQRLRMINLFARCRWTRWNGRLFIKKQKYPNRVIRAFNRANTAVARKNGNNKKSSPDILVLISLTCEAIEMGSRKTFSSSVDSRRPRVMLNVQKLPSRPLCTKIQQVFSYFSLSLSIFHLFSISSLSTSCFTYQPSDDAAGRTRQLWSGSFFFVVFYVCRKGSQKIGATMVKGSFTLGFWISLLTRCCVKGNKKESRIFHSSIRTFYFLLSTGFFGLSP